MRPATKQTLFLVGLVLGLLVLIAVVLWQMAKAKHEAADHPPPDRPVSLRAARSAEAGLKAFPRLVLSLVRGRAGRV